MTSYCLRSSGESARLSDRTTPAPGRAAPPPDGSGRGSSSNTYRKEKSSAFGGQTGQSYHLCVRPEEKDSLPGDRACLCVCIVDAFLYGLHQDGPMPGGWRLMAETI